MANADEKTVHAPSQEIQARSPHDARPAGGALDLNTASESEIAEIDMIGAKLAKEIVARRGGGFSSWDEVGAVPGVDAKRVAELQRAARLDRPS